MANGRRGHGEGTVRRRGDGRWEGRLRLPDGRRASAYGKTRAEAVRELDRLRRRVALGRPVHSSPLEVCTFLGEWVEAVIRGEAGGRERPLRERSARNYRDAVALLKRHLCHPENPERHRRVSAVTRDDGTRLQNALEAAKVGKRTQQVAVTLVRRAWAYAEREGFARANVFADIRGPRLESAPPRVLDRPELARLLETAKGRPVEPLALLLVGTGMRIGEALGLRWRDVNLREGSARIVQQQVEDNGEVILRAPKTSASVRTVTLPTAVCAALARHKATLRATPHGERLVFANARGGPLRRPNLLRRAWHPLLDDAKLPRFGFHVMRHTYASHAFGAGIDARTVADQLGHRDASVTLNVYAATVAVGRERLNAAWDQILAAPAS